MSEGHRSPGPSPFKQLQMHEARPADEDLDAASIDLQLGEYQHFGDGGPRRTRDSSKQLQILYDLSRAIYLNAATKNKAAGFENSKVTSSATADAAGIPAGYTYLFQFAAHDIVHTSLAFATAGSRPRLPRNMRRSGLCLETLYGGGPAVCPFVYQQKDEAAPTLLTGSASMKVRGRIFPGPKTDFARFRYPVSESLRFADGPNPRPNIVLAADARNDDNLIIAQLTVLMHNIHNQIVREVSRKVSSSRLSDEIARFLLTKTYQRIVREDLLARILDPEVFKAYEANGGAFFPKREEGSVSLEFAFAAGRLGHAMIRPSYRLRENKSPLSLKRIAMTSSRLPASVPHLAKWQIDWNLFFWNKDTTPPKDGNWALRFGLHIADDLRVIPEPEPGDPHKLGGLLYRDLVRSLSSQIQNAGGVMSAIRRVRDLKGTCEHVRNKDARQALVDAALPGSNIDEADVPLAVFLQLEAQSRTYRGRMLGPLGSVVVAEGMHAAFSTNKNWMRYGIDETDIAAAEACVDGLSEINSFPDLITRFYSSAHFNV